MKTWREKEKRDEKFFEGKRTRGSGNQWYSPGDTRTDKFLIESKHTDKKSYSLNKAKLQKIASEALFVYKIPLMSIRIQDLEVIVVFKEDWNNLTKKTNCR